jgi:hypothetical protein
MSRFTAKIFTVMLLCCGSFSKAQTTYTSMAVADTFLATGSPANPAGADLTGLNFGGAGMLVVAAAASGKGEFQTVMRFDLAGAADLFNTTYGSNNWTMSGVVLELTSNYGIGGVQPNNAIFPAVAGGKFVVEWLAKDDWAEGSGTPNLPTTDGVTYNSLPELLASAHEILSTNTYTPPGNNVHMFYALPLAQNLVADVSAGGLVSLLFYAADNQIGYLFNSYFYGRGNEPLIHVTATLNAAPLKIVSGYFNNAGFHLVGLGVANASYQIEATTNLANANWQTLGTTSADSAGTIQFDDATTTNQPQRFYRIAH